MRVIQLSVMIPMLCISACSHCEPRDADVQNCHTLTWRYENEEFVYVWNNEAIGSDTVGISKLKAVELPKGAEVHVTIAEDPWSEERPGRKSRGLDKTCASLLPHPFTGLPLFWLERGVRVTYFDPNSSKLEVHTLTYQDFGPIHDDPSKAKYIFDARPIGIGENGYRALKRARPRKGSIVQVICPWTIGPSSWNPKPPGLSLLMLWRSEGIMLDIEEDRPGT